MAVSNLKNIKYLSFEGGGGKGVAYLGAIQGLEEQFYGASKPLFNVVQRTLHKKSDEEIRRRVALYNNPLDQTKKNLVGVSGTSAGAITAFMLAMGMTYAEIYQVFNDPDKVFGKKFEMTIKKPFTFPIIPPYTTRTSLSEDTIPISFFEQLFKEFRTHPVTRMWQLENVNNRLKGNLTYVKHKDYTSDIGSEYLQIGGLVENFLVDEENDPIVRKIFDVNAGEHIYGLIHGRGIFSGSAARELVFSSLMRRFLFSKLGVTGRDPREVTFEDFFYLTGVDLVLTGTNLSTQEPKLFSVYHTPDFPVIEAVSISMNLPFIFRPVYINGAVKFSGDDAYNRPYRGLYADGGIITNLPFRVFYNLQSIILKKGGRIVETGVPVCGFDYEDRFNQEYSDMRWTLGFVLEDQSPKEIDQDRIFTKELKFRLKDDGLNLYNAFFFRGSSGQFSRDEAATRKIQLNITGLSLTDFASAKLNDVRGNMAKFSEYRNYEAKDEIINYEMKMSALKVKRIEEARQTTNDFIRSSL